ncbi:MAG: hypothetical protein KDB27_29675 [Planctomycetales bacterium]|nr:hypothetical protein [Planctomycetales bacterium]
MSISVANLSGHVTKPAEAGAERFILTTLPMFGETPWGKEEESSRGVDLDVVSRDFSNQLKSAAEQLEIDYGVEIFIPDALALHEKIVNDPIGTGFPNQRRIAAVYLLTKFITAPHFKSYFPISSTVSFS